YSTFMKSTRRRGSAAWAARPETPSYERRRAVPRRELLPLRGQRSGASRKRGGRPMSDPALGLMMLTLIVIVIMLGFPTAFTLMGLGMMFGFVAFYDPSHSWTE